LHLMKDAIIGSIRGVRRRPSEAAQCTLSKPEASWANPMQAGQTRCKLGKPDAIRDDPDAPRRAQAHPGAPIRTQAHADPSRRKQERTALKTLAFPNDLRRAPRDDWP
jgi:hypothetical protein